MPAKPRWLLRLPEIIASVEALGTPVVDRLAIQKLFSVGRRQAIKLLHHFGGYQSAQSFLVDRAVLIRRLGVVCAGAAFAYEHGRRCRLADQLEETDRWAASAAIRIPVKAASLTQTLAALPQGIRLEPGRLEVRFAGAEDLLARLFDLSQVAARDFDAFRTHVEERPPNR